MSGRIRASRREDIPCLLDIYNYEVENGVATFDIGKKTLEEWEEWYDSHVKDGALLVWEENFDGGVGDTVGSIKTADEGAQGDTRPVGYVTLSHYRPRKAYSSSWELSLYVHPDWRRKGIGRELMAAMLQKARERSDVHTVISVITGENVGSIKLHEEFGFKECGRIKEVGQKFGRYLDTVSMQVMV